MEIKKGLRELLSTEFPAANQRQHPPGAWRFPDHAACDSISHSVIAAEEDCTDVKSTLVSKVIPNGVNLKCHASRDAASGVTLHWNE